MEKQEGCRDIQMRKISNENREAWEEGKRDRQNGMKIKNGQIPHYSIPKSYQDVVLNMIFMIQQKHKC